MVETTDTESYRSRNTRRADATTCLKVLSSKGRSRSEVGSQDFYRERKKLTKSCVGGTKDNCFLINICKRVWKDLLPSWKELLKEQLKGKTLDRPCLGKGRICLPNIVIRKRQHLKREKCIFFSCSLFNKETFLTTVQSGAYTVALCLGWSDGAYLLSIIVRLSKNNDNFVVCCFQK